MTVPGPASTLDDLVAAIAPARGDRTFVEARREAVERWATRAKPPGSLGRLEALAAQVAGITGTCPPDVPEQPVVVVFAGDHGVVADGASAWPSEVTGLMVRAMAAGGAAINAFATSVGAAVSLVDVGVASDLSGVEAMVDAKVRAGTASLLSGPAMSRDDALTAMGVGAAAATVSLEDGADLLVGGDMGIGNTTPAAALICRLAGGSPADLVGPGAGVPAEGLGRKREIVSVAVERAAGLADPIDVLAEIGGLEIAALAGYYLAGVSARVPVLVDGVIGCAALCVAESIAPGVASWVIAGHRSTEPAATAALDHLGLEPLLHLDLRLGEGTGACLAIPLVQAAVRALRDMADLPG